MDISQIRYFCEAARQENITRAAEALFVSQPALSLSIQRLEKELHVQLFERSNRSVRLTPQGSIFLSHAERMLFEADSAIARLDYYEKTSANKVMILHHPMIHEGRLIKKSMERFPEMAMQFAGATQHVMQKLMTDGIAQLAIMIDKPSLEYEFIPLHKEELVLLIPDGDDVNPEYKKIGEEVPLADLKHLDWVSYNSVSRRFRLLKSFFLDAGYYPHVCYEASSILGLCEAVRYKKLASLVPVSAISQFDMTGLRTAKIASPGCCFDFYLAWIKDRPLSVQSLAAKEFIIEMFSKDEMDIDINN